MKLREAKTVADLNPRTRKILLTLFFLPIILLFIVLLIPGESNQEEQTDESVYIEGLDPWLSNSALKEYGFTTDRDMSTDGCTWTAERKDLGITYTTLIFSHKDADKASSFRLTIMVEPGIENIRKGKWMMRELSGIPYAGSDAVKAYNWVDENYNNDNASIDISGVRFTISSPTDFVRILNLNKINPETGDIYY